jgi:hypothetical protein
MYCFYPFLLISDNSDILYVLVVYPHLHNVRTIIKNQQETKQTDFLCTYVCLSLCIWEGEQCIHVQFSELTLICEVRLRLVRSGLAHEAHMNLGVGQISYLDVQVASLYSRQNVSNSHSSIDRTMVLVQLVMQLAGVTVLLLLKREVLFV